jgi:hypothetical protein
MPEDLYYFLQDQNLAYNPFCNKQENDESLDSLKKILFVSGVSRSGTSALVDVLNTHNKILIGQERYWNIINDNKISKSLFLKSRFLDIKPGDTHQYGNILYKEPADIINDSKLLDRFDNATYIGDKFPNLYIHFTKLFSILPNAKHIYIVRNPFSVLESYHVRSQDSYIEGMKNWNASVSLVANLPKQTLSNFFIVQYEKIFENIKSITLLFESLKLTPPPEKLTSVYVEQYKVLNNKKVDRKEHIRSHVSLNADWESYRKIIKLSITSLK